MCEPHALSDGLLLIVAIPIFIGLANKALYENAEAIQRGFGR
jgi:hypothetical protein